MIKSYLPLTKLLTNHEYQLKEKVNSIFLKNVTKIEIALYPQTTNTNALIYTPFIKSN